MHRVVFYSWQSDLPNRTNRSFIQQALENVTKDIRADDAVDVEPVVDRDTQGIPGSPDITKTIFQKIANADVIVADVSQINPPGQGRPSPNPNVLLELGYALHALGDERVVLVFNTAYGKLEDLPFDLRMRRVMPYNMPASTQDRAGERKLLESKLDDALRAALKNITPAPVVSPVGEALDAIEKVAPNRIIVVRRFLSELYSELEARRPKSFKQGATAQDLLDAIDGTVGIAADYARLAQAVAVMGDEEASLHLYRSFGVFLNAYDPSIGYSGTVCPADGDFMKFVGHEFFVTLFACLISERRWALISKLLTQGIPVKHSRSDHRPSNSTFDNVSEYLESFVKLDDERQRMCVHADVLKKRHEQQPLSDLMPFDEFVAADYFLFLRGELPFDGIQGFKWRPWSSLFMRTTPRFLIDAKQSAIALEIASALGLRDVDTLKAKLRERIGKLRQMWRNPFWTQPVEVTDIDRIGTV